MITTETARLALDTILRKPDKRVPSYFLNIMEHSVIERIAGARPGDYVKDPHGVYIRMTQALDTCLLDQYLAENHLTMGDHGYDGKAHGVTTGVGSVILDGMVVDSPEAVVEHMEKFVFPRIRAQIDAFNESARVHQILSNEARIQEMLGPGILKTGHGFVAFPVFAYGTYGYVNYFSAYALYPDVM